MTCRFFTVLTPVASGLGCATLLVLAVARPATGQALTLNAVLRAEAARATEADQVDLLRRAARQARPVVQRAAVRALGRLERPPLVPELAALLIARDPRVRAEAANAVAQAAGQDGDAADRAREALAGRLPVEKDAEVRAAISEALGRLPVSSPDEAGSVERAILAEATLAPEPEARVRTIGALRGLEALVRLRKKLFSPTAETVTHLQRLAASPDPRVRRLAFLALNGAGAAAPATIDRGLTDADVEVRRLAAAAVSADSGQVQRALSDRSPVVRYEALRAYGRRFRSEQGCGPLVAAVGDDNPHVALLALDLLAQPCQAGDRVEQRLLDVAVRPFAVRASAVPTGSRRPRPSALPAPVAWHRQAHAIVSLAAVAPERAKPLLGRFASSELWPVRMYAARAATHLGDAATLAELAGEKNANVREAAIAGLARLRKHEADSHYLQALDAEDNQLVMTAAQALAGTPARESATRAIVSALQRWTARDTDNSRDPRLALLDRLQELGSPDSAAALAPLLRDADPRVAERAAAVVTALTGQASAASPARRSPQDVPSASELARLSRSLVRVTMANGRSFDVRLLTDLAPLSCTRFARLVASGYYNGLTFHRVVSNFLIQGGSPGANEYVGHRRFMRDETGRVTQARGTLGTSTRGRDTGDAQIYINVVDNPRLDHDYTIFGEIVRGMAVVDDVQEADTIARAVLVRRVP